MKLSLIVVLSCLFVYGAESMASIDRATLEQYSVKELFDLIQSKQYKQHRKLAAEVYGSKYGHIPVQGVHYNLDDIEAFDHIIYIGKVGTFIDFLNAFKGHIKNIKLNIQETVYRSEENRDHIIPSIFASIRENCAANLTHFELLNDNSEYINDLKDIAFPNVEELSLYNCALYNNKGEMDVKAAFPNVRRLKALETHHADDTWIKRNFPNLTHLQVTVGSSHSNGITTYITERRLCDILKEIPSITSLSMGKCETGILSEINLFAQIINLELISPQLGNHPEPIRMQHVRNFSCQDVGTEIQNFVKFDKIQKLKWQSQQNYVRYLVSFVQEISEKIEELEIQKTFGILDKDFQEMGELDELLKLNIIFDPYSSIHMTANGLIEFIKKNEQLAEVHLFEIKPFSGEPKLKNELAAAIKSGHLQGFKEYYTNGDIDYHLIKESAEKEESNGDHKAEEGKENPEETQNESSNSNLNSFLKFLNKKWF